jgi:hypothetical protein
MTSPMLTEQALKAAEPWRTEWITDEADGTRGPTSYVLKADQIIKAFLAAQDRDALSDVVAAAMRYGHPHDGSDADFAVDIDARRIVDALLGPEVKA